MADAVKRFGESVAFLALLVLIAAPADAADIQGDVLVRDMQPAGLTVSRCELHGDVLVTALRNGSSRPVHVESAMALHREYAQGWFTPRMAVANLLPGETSKTFRYTVPEIFSGERMGLSPIDGLRCYLTRYYPVSASWIRATRSPSDVAANTGVQYLTGVILGFDHGMHMGSLDLRLSSGEVRTIVFTPDPIPFFGTRQTPDVLPSSVKLGTTRVRVAYRVPTDPQYGNNDLLTSVSIVK